MKNKCDFCVYKKQDGGCQVEGKRTLGLRKRPTSADCKEATEKYFKYSMLEAQNSTTQTVNTNKNEKVEKVRRFFFNK